MGKDLVSIIVPVFNAKKYLRECVNSILNQTYRNIELICVDDGSTDESLDILKSYAKDDNRIRILTQPNLYSGVARNYGMKEARGKYVIFLDADDFFDCSMIEKLHRKAVESNSDICLCDADYYENNLGTIDSNQHVLFVKDIERLDVFSYIDIPDKIYQISLPAPWNKLYKRSFILDENLAFENTRRANDLLFFGTSMVAAKRISFINEQLVHYRVNHTGHLQSQYSSVSFTELETLKKVKNFLHEKDRYNNVEESFLRFVVGNSFYLLYKTKRTRDFVSLYNMIFHDIPFIKYDRANRILKNDIIYNKMCTQNKYGKAFAYIYYKIYRMRKGK